MKSIRNIILLLLVTLMTACAGTMTPRVDGAFGESVRQTKALQTLNPSASANSDPVTGIDGESGRAAIDRYQQSFRTPPKSFEVQSIGGSTPA
ncbi:MAG: hypothetical protein VW339_14300 [Quisquiliibacterium sp.]